jgi:hypothetical protein
MSTVDVLLDLFRGDAGQDDPAGYLEENGVSPEEFLDAMPEVCDSLPPEQAEVLRAAYGLDSPEGAPELDESVASQVPPVPEDATTAELMEHYATVINISHSVNEAGDTVYIDQSVNQNIEAYGDVNQSFDQAAVTGDGAVVAGDDSQVNTGEGAVQAGGDVSDSTVATGDVAGSVTGDNDGSTVGDGNAVISDSTVGAASYGGGSATNVEAENANMGDGTIVDDTAGDVNLNSGDGDMTAVDGSTLSESSLGEGDVYSDDPTVAAADGSSVAFGEGSTSTAEEQTTEIDDNFGNVNVADDGDQSATQDYSTNDSFNTEGSFFDSMNVFDNSTNDSANTDGSYNTETWAEDNSYEATDTDASDDDSTYTDNSVSDDDGTDVDASTGMEHFGS